MTLSHLPLPGVTGLSGNPAPLPRETARTTGGEQNGDPFEVVFASPRPNGLSGRTTSGSGHPPAETDAESETSDSEDNATQDLEPEIEEVEEHTGSDNVSDTARASDTAGDFALPAEVTDNDKEPLPSPSTHAGQGLGDTALALPALAFGAQAERTARWTSPDASGIARPSEPLSVVAGAQPGASGRSLPAKPSSVRSRTTDTAEPPRSGRETGPSLIKSAPSLGTAQPSFGAQTIVPPATGQGPTAMPAISAPVIAPVTAPGTDPGTPLASAPGTADMVASSRMSQAPGVRAGDELSPQSSAPPVPAKMPAGAHSAPQTGAATAGQTPSAAAARLPVPTTTSSSAAASPTPAPDRATMPVATSGQNMSAPMALPSAPPQAMPDSMIFARLQQNPAGQTVMALADKSETGDGAAPLATPARSTARPATEIAGAVQTFAQSRKTQTISAPPADLPMDAAKTEAPQDTDGRAEASFQPPDSRSAQTASRPELARHVAAQIAQALPKQAATPVELRLDPEELGRLRLQISTDDTTVTLHVTTERADTSDLMRRNISQLEESYRALGYEKIQISINGQQAGSARHGFARQQDRQDQQGTPGDAPALAVTGASASEITLRPGASPLPGTERVDIRL